MYLRASHLHAFTVSQLDYRGSPTSTVSTSAISTSTIFIAIDIKSELVEFSRIGYVVKFVLVEITM